LAPTDSKWSFVTAGTCESNGFHSIRNAHDCREAAGTFKYNFEFYTKNKKDWRDVVEYVRNGKTHSVYHRTSSVKGFNAYRAFTETWTSAKNKLQFDFEIYDSVADFSAGRDKWNFCNFNDKDVGYPRDCGKTYKTDNQWFSKPGGRFNARGLTSGASFKLFDAENCPTRIFWKLGRAGDHCSDVCERLDSECVAPEMWPQTSEWVKKIAKSAGVKCASTKSRCDIGEAPILAKGSQCLFCDNPKHPGWGEDRRHSLCTRRWGSRQRFCPCKRSARKPAHRRLLEFSA